MKIALLGANGALSRAFLKYSSFSKFTEPFSRYPHHQYIDFLDPALGLATPSLLESYDVILNTIALTNIETCESQPDHAYTINANSISTLLTYIRPSSYLIHISTDMVYDSIQGLVATEEQTNLPDCIYASSKYMGEAFALEHTNSIVLRTNYYGLGINHTFTDYIVAQILSDQDQTIQGYSDITFTPVSAPSLVKMLDILINCRPTGIFNYGCVESISKYDLVAALFHHFLPNGNTARLRTHFSSANWPRARYKSSNMSMDSSKIAKTTGIQPPSLWYDIKNIIK